MLKRYTSHSGLYVLKKIIPLAQKCYCEVGIIIAINLLLNISSRIKNNYLPVFFFCIFLYELRSKPKWESSGRNTSRFQFRSCENNNETSTLFQNDPPSFASSSEILPHSSVTLLHTIESIMNGSEG